MVAVLERHSTFRGAEIARITVTVGLVDESFVVVARWIVLMVCSLHNRRRWRLWRQRLEWGLLLCLHLRLSWLGLLL